MPSTATAAKTPGLISLPQPLDLAGQGRSYHIRVLKIELRRLAGWQPGPMVKRQFRQFSQCPSRPASWSAAVSLTAQALVQLETLCLNHHQHQLEWPGGDGTLDVGLPPTSQTLSITTAHHLPNDPQRGVIIQRATS